MIEAVIKQNVPRTTTPNNGRKVGEEASQSAPAELIHQALKTRSRLITHLVLVVGRLEMDQHLSIPAVRTSKPKTWPAARAAVSEFISANIGLTAGRFGVLALAGAAAEKSPPARFYT